MSERIRCLAAESRAAPAEIVRPVLAAISADEAELHRIDLGRVGQTGSRLGRVVQALMGEVEAARLLREAQAFAPDVALAFDPGALAALALVRERKVADTVVVAVVPDVAPARAWAVAADRYLVVDDEAAVLLADHGVDGARVQVVGPMVAHALAQAARADRAGLRGDHKVPSDVPVVVVDATPLTAGEMQQLLLQLSLLGRAAFVLFDAGSNAEVAEVVRRQVPTFGLRGKLFGDTPNAPRLWRTADIVFARPTPRAIHAALALGAPLVALEPKGEHQQAEAAALAERGMATVAPQMVFASSALEPFLKDTRRLVETQARIRALGSGDGAARVAHIVHELGKDKAAVLAEAAAHGFTPMSPDEEAPPVEPKGAAGEPEDLDDLGELFGDAAPPPSRSAAAEERLHKEVAEMRAAAERWDERARVAKGAGDRSLLDQATREGERKRARMHAALAELGRLQRERAHAPPPEDPLAAFKKKVAKEGPGPRSPDDELAELKRKMSKGPKR